MNLHKRDLTFWEDTSFTRAVDTDPCMVLVAMDVTWKRVEYGTPGHIWALDLHHEVAINRPECCYGRKTNLERTTHIMGAAFVSLVATWVSMAFGDKASA